jgi:2-polyprenyl-3-methyl-5-hydroxy-6-metoxy-1,4-benzoquinol methylase
MDSDFKNKERDLLDKVSTTYVLSDSPYLRFKREYAVHIFLPFIKFNENSSPNGIALQLGCADGFETKLLSGLARNLDVIDGSQEFIEKCKKNSCPNVRFIHSLFEEYKLGHGVEKYDYVFASYVLEHVFDVQPVLDMIKAVLKPLGLLFVIVPNARALSRQLAQHMKIVTDLKELTENDINHGHRRVYDRPDLNRDIDKAGLEIVAQGGIFFKMLAHFQMDKLLEEGFLTRDHMEGLYRLGLEYPDLCDSLYAVCRMKQ